MSFDLNQTIRKLEAYADSPAPILSIYLPLEPETRKDISQLVKNFDQLLALSLAEEHRSTFAKNILYMQGYLEAYKDDNAQCIAMFSGGDNLWEVIHTENQIPPSVTVSHSPNLHPLLQEVRKTQRYLIIMADRAKALFFTLINGELEEKGSVFDQSVPHKLRGKNADQVYDKIDNDIRNHLHKHMELIAEKVNEFVANKVIVGVLIGGHKTTMHELQVCLPKHIKEKIMGEFVSELNLPFNDILIHSKNLLNELHKKT